MVGIGAIRGYAMSLDMIREKIIASIKVKQAIIEDEKLLCKIQKLANDCVHALRSGGKIILLEMAVVLQLLSIYRQNLYRALCLTELL